MASIYLRGKTWWCCYMDNGKKVSKSLKTKVEKIAKFRKNEIENQVALGDSPLPSGTSTAVQCFEEFKKSREGVLDPKTVSVVNQRIKTYFEEAHILRLSSITEASLKAHLDRRIEKDGISHKTANHTIQQVGTFLTFCLRKKYIKENPLRWMKRYRLDPIIPRFLSHNEAQVLLSTAKPTKIYPIVLIALYTGMRWGEIARLDWSDFDIEKNEVVVKKSKTNRFRVIPIAEILTKELLRDKKPGPVVTMNYIQMEWELNKIEEALKIPHFRFHDLRHTFASMAIKSGVDLLTLSKWLGHSVISTTQIYAHLYNDHSQASMKRFTL